MGKFLNTKNPIIFDVGANIGQSTLKFLSQFPESIIHCFEPSPTTFVNLEKSINQKNVHLWNYGVGSQSGNINFLENTHSDMSSFLPLSHSGWGEIIRETEVPVLSVDDFCQKEHIERIDILKSDTQGFDLEVFRGASQMIDEGKVGLVYFEATFSEMYEGLPLFGDIYNFLVQNDFRLFTIYPIYHQDNLASWTDLLFIHKSILQDPSS